MKFTCSGIAAVSFGFLIGVLFFSSKAFSQGCFQPEPNTIYSKCGLGNSLNEIGSNAQYDNFEFSGSLGDLSNEGTRFSFNGVGEDCELSPITRKGEQGLRFKFSCVGEDQNFSGSFLIPEDFIRANYLDQQD